MAKPTVSSFGRKPPAGSAIKPCSCEHAWQDKQYGKGLRVKNQCLAGWRCTVCLNTQ